MLRFAPSPTGDMHIGNLRIAILNSVIARKMKTKLLLRIDDTDANRNISGKDKEILDILRMFRIDFDEMAYQSHGFDFHREMVKRLLNNGKAFYCHCTKEFLEQKKKEATARREPFRYKKEWSDRLMGDKTESDVVRLSVGWDISFVDEIKGEFSFKKDEIGDFVITRGGIPTYNFACAIDDREVDFVIRGEDHVSNTPKQIAVRQALGMNKVVKYAHVPIIMNEQNKKMSKRDAESSVLWLLKKGFNQESILKYLLMLGNHKVEELLEQDYGISIEEISKNIDITSISRSPARFDIKKLRSINRAIIRKERSSELCHKLGYDIKYEKCIEVLKQEANTLREIGDNLKCINSSINAKRLICDGYESEFDAICKVLREQRPHLEYEGYNEFKSFLIEKISISGKSLYKPLRAILTGKESGIELDKIYPSVRPLINDILRTE